VVPTKVEAFIQKSSQQRPTPEISIGSDGTITIPATACSVQSKPVSGMWSWDDGQQLLHSAGSVSHPEQTAFEYEVIVEQDGAYFLTANISTWHMNTDLLLTLASSSDPVDVPVYFTDGYWNETQPIEIKLLKGKNVLRFTRLSEHTMAIKDFLLFESRPVIPTPDPHATPAPSPPMTDYIELPQGKTCVSQGIIVFDETECKVACEYLGYKYTGAKQRAWLSPGCFSLVTGEYAGNCNYNSNTSASDYDPDIRALCLRH
jgi:hypothetical protein